MIIVFLFETTNFYTITTNDCETNNGVYFVQDVKLQLKKAQRCLAVEKIANTKRVEVLTASAEKSSLHYKDSLAKVTALYKAELTKTVKTHILLRDTADDIQVS